jgi:protein disulfide-isomerase
MKSVYAIASLIGAGALLYGLVAFAADPSMDSPSDMFPDLTADKPAPKTAVWQDNFKAASAQAQKDNKAMLLNFTGSDWCPWCIKMDQEVLDSKDFTTYAAENLVLVTVDFPAHKQLSSTVTEQNAALQQKFAIQGFPTFVVLDSKGNKLAQMVGYQPGGPAAFINQVKQAIAKSGS